MSLNETPSGERLHLGFFGVRNAGKSSLVNAVTGQELSVVSEVKGTTTDPVKKAMELLPLGPVVVIDTPGLDDEGVLGVQRVRKAREILAKTDLAVLVVDAVRGLSPLDKELLSLFAERNLPHVVARNKADLLTDRPPLGDREIYVSARTGENVNALKDLLGAFALTDPRRPVSDLLAPGDTAVLVVPIDESAPRGRLILPQQQVMRDLLDAHHSFLTCQPSELPAALAALTAPPKIVITDSQVFGQVSKLVPPEVWLTGFSVLMARYKGDLPALVRGAAALSRLRDGDKVLISEGCTHHRQCNDIGTVKLPRWVEDYCGARPDFHFTSGGEFPEDLTGYALVIHCGGCMLNAREMGRRLAAARRCGVPMANYGIAIAAMHGILRRSLAPFPEVLALLD